MNVCWKWIFLFFCLWGSGYGEGLQAGVIPKSGPFVWHPFVMETEEDLWFLPFYQRPLVQTDGVGGWICGGCSQFQQVPESRPVRFEVSLDPRWKWSDGHSITVQDFQLSWEIAGAFRKRNRITASWQEVREVTAYVQEPQRMQIQMTRSVYPYHYLSSLYILPSHIEGPLWQKCQKSLPCYLEQSTYKNGVLVGGLVSTGPYRVMGADGDVAHLGSNPQALIPPKISEWQWMRGKLPKEASVFWPEPVGGLGEGMQKSVQYMELPSYRLEQISYNFRSSLLLDVQLRRALSVALHKDVLALGYGGLVVDGITHPRDPFFGVSSGAKLGKAAEVEALLVASHWTKGQDGLFRKMQRTLEVELMVEESKRGLAKQIQQQWRQAGIASRIVEVSTQVLLQDKLPKGQFSDAMIYTLEFTPNYSLLHLFDSSREPRLGSRNPGFNLFRWSSMGVDKWIYDFDRELSWSKRKAMWGKIEEMVAEDVPLVPLFFHTRRVAMTQDLRIPDTASSLFRPLSMEVETWTQNP